MGEIFKMKKETFFPKFEREIETLKEKVEKIERKYFEEGKKPPSKKEILKKEVFKVEEEKVEKERKKEFSLRELNYFLEKSKREGLFKTIKEVQKTKNPYLIDAFHDKIIEEIEKRETQ